MIFQGISGGFLLVWVGVGAGVHLPRFVWVKVLHFLELFFVFFFPLSICGIFLSHYRFFFGTLSRTGCCISSQLFFLSLFFGSLSGLGVAALF